MRSAFFPFLLLSLFSLLAVPALVDAGPTFDPKTTVFLEAESLEITSPAFLSDSSQTSDDRSATLSDEKPLFTGNPCYGGWVLDQQMFDQIGSSVLLAHGLGTPVEDATGEIDIPAKGDYRVFVRTRNWVAPWTTTEAPGRFSLLIDGEKIPTEFGTKGDAWNWEFGGTIPLTVGKHRIALHDLTGFDGRVDAICLTSDPDWNPPEEKSKLDAFRRLALNLPESVPDAPVDKADLVVVGGGVAGLCAAVSAARLGLHVILLQDRFLLGGNNSRDVRVHLQGLMNLPPYPNLGNLIYQFQPKQEGNAQPGEFYEDAKKLEIVRAEKNLSLFLGTRVIGVEKEGSRITAVIAKNLLTGKEERFRGHLFADCSGDGNLGFLAGADWRMGRESREETGESCAPEIADSMTMGASIQWFAVETDEETTFPELPWAIQFTPDSIKPSTHGDWDWETGMNLDQINDIERIRDNGLRAAYGHWSYMKNDSDADWREKVRKMKLGWVSFTAGKRESRRLLGDVILQEQDIREGKVWPDGTVTTTWPIDLHYPEESNQKFFPGEEFRAICKTIQSPPYAIPYRCFYSRNIENLFMAGRDISVTHAALGTVRVMRTGGMMGEVVGMAAAVCREHNALPRDVYEKYFEELREKMTVGVAPPVPGQMEVKEPDWAKDLENIAPKATVTASSLGENGNRPVSLLIDGKADPDDPGGLFLTEKGKVHFVRFDFPDPVTLTGIHFVSGNLDPTKRNHYVLQYFDGKDWIDVPEAFIKNRWGLDYSLTFPPIQAESFRLLQEFYYSLEPLRLWEVELFAKKTNE